MADAEQRDEDERPRPGTLMREVGDWEAVSDGLRSYTQRKAVPGGWLYRTVVEQYPAMCFVPTPPPVNEVVPQQEHEEDEIERIEGHA